MFLVFFCVCQLKYIQKPPRCHPQNFSILWDPTWAVVSLNIGRELTFGENDL